MPISHKSAKAFTFIWLLLKGFCAGKAGLLNHLQPREQNEIHCVRCHLRLFLFMKSYSNWVALNISIFACVELTPHITIDTYMCYLYDRNMRDISKKFLTEMHQTVVYCFRRSPDYDCGCTEVGLLVSLTSCVQVN